MRALILAAGRGKRLRPLTDTVPKPLVKANGHMLCEWNLAALKKAGITDIVMNTAHLADAFEDLPARLDKDGFRLTLSREGDRAEDALESLGGIVKALPLLVPENDPEAPFLVLAGDVVHDFDLTRLTSLEKKIRDAEVDGAIVGVPNPSFHPTGDMTINGDATIVPGAGVHTYGCLMIVSPRIFKGLRPVASKLFPWLWDFARAKRIIGFVHEGFWGNVGSPEELEHLIETGRVP